MITPISDKGAEKVREFLSGQESDVSMAGLRVGVRGRLLGLPVQARVRRAA